MGKGCTVSVPFPGILFLNGATAGGAAAGEGFPSPFRGSYFSMVFDEYTTVCSLCGFRPLSGDLISQFVDQYRMEIEAGCRCFRPLSGDLISQ